MGIMSNLDLNKKLHNSGYGDSGEIWLEKEKCSLCGNTLLGFPKRGGKCKCCSII